MTQANHDETIALMRQGRFSEAEARLERALALDAVDARALRLLGTVFHLSDRPGDAKAMLERALAIEPDNTATLLNLGSVHLGSGRLPEAERCFARVVEIDPRSVDGHYNLGLVAQRTARLDDAERHYARAIELDPQALDAAVNLAVVHLDRGRHEACVAETRRVLEREPAHRQARLVQLQALIASRRFGEAERVLDAAPVTVAEHPEMRAIEGGLHLRCGRLAQAGAALRSAIARGDVRARTALDLARCLLESGEAEDAVGVLREAAARHPEVAECHALLGLALRESAATEQALAAYEAALALAPASVHYLTAKARLLFELGRDEAAERSVDAAIEAAPAVVSPHLLRLERHAARGDLAAALDICDQYLERAGVEHNMLAAKGFLLHALGRSAAATRLVDLDRLIATWTLAPPEGYADLASFNEALTRHIRAHPSLSRGNAASKATQHGRQSGDLLLGDAGPFADFERLLWHAAERYTAALERDPTHPFLAHAPALDAVHCWAVVLERSGYQTPHIHPSAWVSGVYYPQLPAVVRDGASEQGWLEFGAPPPELAFEPRPPTRRIRPEAGLIVLFPSYFYHGTVPFESDEQRISIAFDFSPRREARLGER